MQEHQFPTSDPEPRRCVRCGAPVFSDEPCKPSAEVREWIARDSYMIGFLEGWRQGNADHARYGDQASAPSKRVISDNYWPSADLDAVRSRLAALARTPEPQPSGDTMSDREALREQLRALERGPSSEVLLPCPFCGGEAEASVGEKGDGTPWPLIECLECEAVAEPHVWNHRTALARTPEPQPPPARRKINARAETAYDAALQNDEPILGSPRAAFVAGYRAALTQETP